MIPALIFGLALAAIGTVVILCAVRLTDPEPSDLPVIAESRREAESQFDREVEQAMALAAHVARVVPLQRRESRWS